MIAGVDEVGRGPLAGPVIAAAVILEHPIAGVMDSKCLSPKKRQALALLIQEQAQAFAFGRVEPHDIDHLNIHQATLLAMQRAVWALPLVPTEILVDGAHRPQFTISCTAIIKGDSLIHQISAASIIAKVLRDEEMERMEEIYPGYGFAAHKGYPTEQHRKALQQLGPCPIHRMSFAPVKNCLDLSKKLSFSE